MPLIIILLGNPHPTSTCRFPVYHQKHPLITNYLDIDENRAVAQPTKGNMPYATSICESFPWVG